LDSQLSERFLSLARCVAGFDLLKKKSDALSARLRGLLKDIKTTKEAVGKEMSGATFAISEAVWAAGDFRKKVRPPRALAARCQLSCRTCQPNNAAAVFASVVHRVYLSCRWWKRLSASERLSA
jgi:hypothetical protein